MSIATRFMLLTLVVALALSHAQRASAQNYPSKPIRMIVPFPPGGIVDTVGRIAASKLSAGVGLPVVMDNRQGAGGNIGINVAAKAPADGYTLMTAANFFTINPSLYNNAGYDPIRDFEPVSLLTSYMLLLAVHPSFEARSVKALIAMAKAQPGKINYASAGIGTTTHIAVELFNYMADVRLAHVPYKGVGSGMVPDTLSGLVPVQFNSPAIVPHIKAGKLLLIGVTGPKRSPLFPDVPTVAEAGVPGYEATGWNALCAPAGTRPAIIRRVNAEIVKGFSQLDVIEILAKQGLDEASGPAEALAALVKSEVPKWAKVIKAAGIQAE